MTDVSPVRTPRALQDPWPAPTRRFVVSDEARLSVLDWGGEGRPILLLHGVGGNAWMWGPVAARLRTAGHVLAMDLRGYGASQWSKDLRYETDDHAGDVQVACEALELEELDVVGFSWGGLVALATASSFPDRVRRLVMIDIAPSSPLPVDAIPPAFRAAFADHAEAVEGERALAPRATEEVLDLLASRGTRPAEGGGLVRAMDPHLTTRWPFRADDRWEEFRALQIPTLVVRSGDSPTFSREDAEAMAAVPSVEVVTVPDAGHLVVAEQPGAVAAVVTDFLRR